MIAKAAPAEDAGRPFVSLAYLAGAAVFLGAVWPLTKVAVSDGAGAMWFALGRAALSALCSAALLAAYGRLRLPGRADLPALLAVGLLQLAAFFLLTHEAVVWVPAGRGSILANTTIPWTIPLSYVLLGERPAARRLAAAGIALLGVMVLIGPWGVDWSDGHVVIGHFLLLAVSLSWTLAILVVRLRPPGMSMLELLPWCCGLAALALLPAALLHPVGRWHAGDVAALAAVGLVAGPAGTWCVLQATAALPVAVSSTGFLAAPATGLLLSVVFLHEALTPDLMLGTALIIMGVVLASAVIQTRGRVR